MEDDWSAVFVDILIFLSYPKLIRDAHHVSDLQRAILVSDMEFLSVRTPTLGDSLFAFEIQ